MAQQSKIVTFCLSYAASEGFGR